MNIKNVKQGVLALVASGAVSVFVACNSSNDYAKNDATKSADTSASNNVSANNDTTMNNTTVADTSSTSSNKTVKSTTASKKKTKVTIGDMSNKSAAKMPDKNGVYEITDVRPMFPGGHDALENYVTNNIDYSQTGTDNNREGTVNVQFVIDENGKVTDAKVIGNKLGNGFDEAATRVISDMPKWTPGKVKGKDVKTRVVLPVTFKPEE